MPSVRGARERSTARLGARAGLGPPASGGRPRGTITRRMGGVDYTLAKRALLMDFQRGILRKPDICDAHPELLRAGRYLGEEATRPCPVCEEGDLRLLAYVFADGLRQNNGRAFQVTEALKLTSKLRSATCYIVEVCLDCSWNYLSEAFLSRPAS